MDSPREEGDDDEGAAADVDDTPRSARSERRRRSPREDSEDSRHAAVHSEMKRQLSTKKIHNVHQLRQRLRSLSYDNGGQNPAKLFQQFDVDSSGALDYAEFTAAVRKGGKVTRQWMSDLELKQLFETVDTSGDKEITIDELTAFVWGADAVPASLRSPSGAAGSPRGRRGRKSAADSGPEIQEALYDEFEKTLVADDEPGAGASAQLSESPPSSSRRGRGGGEEEKALSGWGEEGNSEDEATMAAFERGIDGGSGRKSRSASSLRSLVSPARRQRSPSVEKLPVQPYYDPSLPSYRPGVASAASMETLNELSKPLSHKVTPRSAGGSDSPSKPMWKVNTTPRVVVDRGTAFRLHSQDPDDKEDVSQMDRLAILARKANPPKEGASASAGPDITERLYAAAQQQTLNLETKRKAAEEAAHEEEAEICKQFKANPVKGKAADTASGTPVHERMLLWMKSREQTEQAKLAIKEKEFQEEHTFKPAVNERKGGQGAQSTGDIHTRHEAWTKARDQKMEDKRKEKAKAEVEGLSFQPEISAKANSAEALKVRAGSPVHDRLYRRAAESQQFHKTRVGEVEHSAKKLAARGAPAMTTPSAQRDVSLRLLSPPRTRQANARDERRKKIADASPSQAAKDVERLRPEQVAATVSRLSSPGRIHTGESRLLNLPRCIVCGACCVLCVESVPHCASCDTWSVARTSRVACRPCVSALLQLSLVIVTTLCTALTC